jgi:ribosomal protein L34E
MTSPKFRNSRLKKNARRTPGGRIAVKYTTKGKPVHKCSICGRILRNVDSGKRQSRAYGGSLCHTCLSDVMKYAARVKCKAIKAEEVPIRYRELINTVAKKI